MPKFEEKKTLSTRQLSLILAGLGTLLASLLFYPISLVFDGSWKLNQEISLFYIEKINLFGFEFPVGTVSLRFYSICILLGMLAGYSLVLFLSSKNHIASTTIDRMFIGMVIVGIVGARFFYVVFNLDKYSINPIEAVTEITRGGLAIFGAIIFCLVYLWNYCTKFKFNFFEFSDILAPGLLLGQVIGRIGNFFNYEAYGGPTSAYWKMYVPQTANLYSDINQQYFHPTFIYEIIPNFILLIILLFNYEKLTVRRSGIIFGMYAIGYGVIRFFTEFFRLDALKITLGTTIKIGPFNFENIFVSQISAVILFVSGILVIYFRSRVIYSTKTMVEVRV